MDVIDRGSDDKDRKAWYSRGYLPHFDADEVTQMVTFRLADSFPQERLIAWRAELASLTDREADVELRKRIQVYLDKGIGAAWLGDDRIGRLVQDALLHFDGARYRLHAWVVMPNHVHVLVTLARRNPLPDVVHSWKSYTAHAANRILLRTGEFWSREFFDRYIRDERHYAAAVAYIEANPVRAGLCAMESAWPYSSAAR